MYCAAPIAIADLICTSARSGQSGGHANGLRAHIRGSFLTSSAFWMRSKGTDQ